MDTATQAILGAAIGQAGFGRRLGRRALGWGAFAGLVPDLDVLAVAVDGPFAELLWHRGPTHALWFGPLLGPLLGWAVWRRHAARRARRGPSPPGAPDPGAPEARRAWIALFVLALLTHPLLDSFTAYGTQLLAPFSFRRFAWNGVGIIDPFYSVPLLAALLYGLARGVVGSGPRRAAAVALAATTLYLLYGVALNQQMERAARAQLAAKGQRVVSLRSYPTIFQPWLRRVVAHTEDEVWVGLATSLHPERMRFERARRPPHHPLIDRLRATREGELFVWFAMGEVLSRVRATGDGGAVVEIDDLRYGLPGAPAEGMWGIRGVFDRRGELRGAVERFSRRRARRAVRPLLGALFRAAFGDLSALDAPAPRV